MLGEETAYLQLKPRVTLTPDPPEARMDGQIRAFRADDVTATDLLVAIKDAAGVMSWRAIFGTLDGFAPDDAKYLLQTADADLPNAQAMGALATGLVKNATTTGIQSIAAQGVDYYAPGGTDVAVVDGGTGASTALAARANLGLVIGANVQAWDTDLDQIAGLTYGADLIAYFTAAHAAATTTLSSFGRTLIDDADATAARATLGLVIGTNVQAWDADLDTWATKTAPSGVVVGTTDSQTLTTKTLDNTNTVTLKDTLFTLQDDGDTSKQARFQLSGIATATTRTYTLPDRTDTLVDLGSTQTLAAKTLTTPTIASFTNATHDHSNAAGGGQISIATGISGLATGIATFLATPSSANLATAVTDETGSGGALVFASSPTITTPTIASFTNATHTHANAAGGGQVAISTGISGLAANIATFLGTPSSGNLLAATTDETGSGLLVFATRPTVSLQDTLTTFQDDGDNTKQARFELSAIATGTTRTYTLPDRTDTLVDLGSTQTLAAKTLTTPTIASFANANHDHSNSAGGGQIAISTGISGLAAGVATFLGTPSSANLRTALTDETGTGAAVFATRPTITLQDTLTTFQDDGDNTKQALFELSGITTGTTRTYTLPNRTDTLVDLGSSQTLTSKTLTTPTIGDFTNSTHTHANAAGGGQVAISTGISGLAAGIATFLGTPSSANLKTAVTDETGSGGALVFATSPTITTPTIADFTNSTHTHLNAAGGGVLTGYKQKSLGYLSPPGPGLIDATSATAMTTGQCFARFLGHTEADYASIVFTVEVITAVATAITWAEIAIATAPTATSNALTLLGSAIDVSATFNSTGVKTNTITVAIPAGSYLYLIGGSAATTPYQLLRGPGDHFGVGIVKLGTFRPSTMAAASGFSASTNTTGAAVCLFRFT